MTPVMLKDQSARERIRADLETTLVVEAAAGTGKTSELVRRIVRTVAAGRARLSEIVAVTFTDRAGGEMKLRLRAAIEEARKSGDASIRPTFDRALLELETARIGTIHSFCAELLRERPVRAGVDPLFAVCAGEEEQRLFDEAFDGWFAAVLKDPPEGVRRLLRRRPRFAQEAGPRETLRDAGRKLMSRRDFPGAWERPAFARDAAIDALYEELQIVGGFASRARDPSDWLAKSVAEIQRFVSEIEHRERVAPRDYDGLEAALCVLSKQKLWDWRGRAQALFGEGVERTAVLHRRDALRANLDRLVARAEADLAAALNSELQPLCAAYADVKARDGCLDFLDLLMRTRDLVRDDAEMRRELQRRFQCILVDEFQDTDPLQAEILLLLAADDPAETDWRRVRPVPGKLFVVGDPKQSIYRFRRADVALYESIKAQLCRDGAALLHLTTSFRSLPAIQEAINAAFAPVLNKELSPTQVEYVPLSAFRDPSPAQPAVVALPVPRPYGSYGKVTQRALEDSYPDAVAAFVEHLVSASGFCVTERSGEAPVPIAARHVCLLFKRFQSFGHDLTAGYRQALEAREIPHVLVGGRSFFDRDEILASRVALTAIEWPDDELQVYATLRGLFFGLGDDALLAFKEACGSLHPFKPVADEVLDDVSRPVAEALAILRELHRGRNYRPIADTLGALLGATRAQAGLAIWPGGEQALANVSRLMDKARRFEAAGGLSFRAFIDRLAMEIERGEAAEAPAVEEGTEGVRIMTVHQAKGLEFPVVIICDPTAPALPSRPSRWLCHETRTWVEPVAHCTPAELLRHEQECIQQDGEETVRVAYVAATRARDLLVVPATGDDDVRDHEGRWWGVLAPCIYPGGKNRQRPRAVPGTAMATGGETVSERPSDALERAADCVRAGAHSPMAGAHEVVWWDPAQLRLGVVGGGGLRHQDLLVEDEGSEVAATVREGHARWVAHRAELLARGSAPSIVTRPMTSAEAQAQLSASSRHAAAIAVAIEEVSVDRSRRPSGRRFGTLVHASLASVPLDADREQIRAVVLAESRVVGASGAEEDAAVDCLVAALAHPVLREAAQSPRLLREVPVMLQQQDGLSEGVVDLVFATGAQGFRVVEMKTDRELGPHRARYTAQAQLYAEAISAATGASVDAVILWV